MKSTIVIRMTVLVSLCSLWAGGAVAAPAESAKTPKAPASAPVRRWEVHEITLTAQRDTANPHRDVTVTATFTAPGIKKVVRGFWDGGRAFKVRFTPTVEANWQVSIASTPPDPGLTTSTQFQSLPAAPGSHGFIRRDPRNPYHFIRDDGTRFFLFGQTYYKLMGRAEPDWKASIDGTARRGMNKIRFLVPPTEVGATDEPAYWRKLDDVVRYMNAKNILADFIVFGFGSGAVPLTREAAEPFLRYLLARYAAFPNVTWCLVNEWNYRPAPIGFWNALGAIAKNEDPWNAEGQALRMLSIHQQTRIDWQFFDQSWPTHVCFQYGVRNKGKTSADEWKKSGATKYRHGDEWGNAGILFNMGHKMPVVNDEYGYIGEPRDDSERPVRDLTREKHRHIIWGIYTAGGYGSAGDKRTCEDGLRPYMDASVWRDPVEFQDIQRLVEFFTTKGLNFYKMSAHNELVKAGARVYALAEPGRQYVVYAAAGGTFTLDLAPGAYHARRFDPRTGEVKELGEINGGGVRSFELPDPQDWVVYLLAQPPRPGR